uniref:cadherin EGF LAG seven-pass G-type receptor 1 isoform X2 n=1 Tax=Callithrix jacchus TaxID=9483 RepID=UPI0023DD01F8|nr:cadherin EGF LAG seven-pass G-type receptor 1 isoform X2 [Callithrix jacchus]
MCGWAGFSTWPQVTRFHPFLRLKNILLWMYIAVSSSLHNGRTVLAVDIFDKLNFTGATVPRFDTIQEEFPRELQSSVSFPADFFKPPEEKEGPLGRPAGRRTTPQTTRPGPGTEREAPISRQRRHPDDAGQFAVALVIIYRTLGQFLPEHYDPDRRSLHISGTGGWSARGCKLLSRNRMHVTCQCSHTASFTVLMDISRHEVGIRLWPLCPPGLPLGLPPPQMKSSTASALNKAHQPVKNHSGTGQSP